jgi:Uma2 family endonuclease
MSEAPRPRYVVDPAFPRAPSQRVWSAMSPEERLRVQRELPVHLPEHLMPPPSGDEHYEATKDAREALRGYFARSTSPLYVSGEMAVYYPDELAFQPDVFAVRDVALHKRDTWMVSAEGRGLDWVLEVLVKGDRRKDLEQNVLRYARLGITEYFIFEPRARLLRGYRLTAPGVAMYESLAGDRGVFASKVLGLDLTVLRDGRLRFRRGDDDLLVPQEVIDRLEAYSDEATAAAEEAALLIEEEQRRARDAEQRATDAEQRATDAEQRAIDAERRARADAEARAEAERRARADREARAEVERRLAEVEARLRALEGAPKATKPKRSR